MEINRNMLIFTSAWGPPGEEKPTFRMLPLTNDCPYLECIFDPANKILAVISKIEKKTYTMVPRIDDNGDVVMIKGGKPRPNNKQYKEERRQLESYQEFYIEKPEEIHKFVGMFGLNVVDWNDRIRAFIAPKAESKVPPGEIQFAMPGAATAPTAKVTTDPKQMNLEDAIKDVASTPTQPMTVVPKD